MCLVAHRAFTEVFHCSLCTTMILFSLMISTLPLYVPLYLYITMLSWAFLFSFSPLMPSFLQCYNHYWDRLWIQHYRYWCCFFTMKAWYKFVFASPQAGHVLGSEVIECLSWRRGALFYMYCHTLFNDPQRRQQNSAHLLQVLPEVTLFYIRGTVKSICYFLC